MCVFESATGPELIIVTGAGRGIGRAIATTLGKSGQHILCISQSAKAMETAQLIRDSGGRADGLVIDLAKYESAETEVSQWLASTRYTRIGVVLAAAILGPSGPLYSTQLSEWERTFQINVLGNLAVVRAILPRQMEASFGRILFFAGGGAAYAYPIFPGYAASKTALVRIVENLDKDLKGSGNFAVAILAPGAVETDTLATVRASGGYVRTTVGIEEPVAFAKAFINSSSCSFSGCFVHVRDTWAESLNVGNNTVREDLWKLRRVE